MTQPMIDQLMRQLQQQDQRRIQQEDRLACILVECSHELARIERYGGEAGFPLRILALARGETMIVTAEKKLP